MARFEKTLLTLMLILNVLAINSVVYGQERTPAALQQSGETNDSLVMPVVPDTIDTSGTARILFESTPVSATIALNGNVIGQTPKLMDNLKSGTYQIKISSPGFRPIEKTMTFRTGARKKIAAQLIRLTPGVIILSTPDSALVKIDHKVVGSTPCFDSLLSIGQHSFSLTKSGYVSVWKPIYFSGYGRDTLRITLISKITQDSINAVSMKKAKTAGQVLLGATSLGFFIAGSLAQFETQKAIEDKKDAYAAYSQPGLSQSEYNQHWESYSAAGKSIKSSATSRNWRYGIGAILAAGLALTIVF